MDTCLNPFAFSCYRLHFLWNLSFLPYCILPPLFHVSSTHMYHLPIRRNAFPTGSNYEKKLFTPGKPANPFAPAERLYHDSHSFIFIMTFAW